MRQVELLVVVFTSIDFRILEVKQNGYFTVVLIQRNFYTNVECGADALMQACSTTVE